MADAEVDTFNAQLVGSHGDFVVVMAPKPRMTKAEALSQAAWLVVCAMPEPGEFEKVLAAVLNT